MLVPMLCLMVGVLLALGIPLATNQARSAAQTMFLDRLGDASRFASIAQQVPQDSSRAPLEREFRRYREVYGIDAALLDREGRVRVASDGFHLPVDSGWLAQALGGRRPDPPAEIWPWDRSPMVVAEPVIDGGDVVGVVVTVSPTDRARGQLGSAWLLLAGIIAAVMAVCVLLAIAVARWVLRPVRVVDRVAHDIATGQLAARVPVERGPVELRRLSTSFNEMADSMSEVLNQQRVFVADASHQLRNQLHALMIRLEGITLTLPADHVADADRAAAEGRRLAAMLEKLLQLAKVDGGDHDGHLSRVDVQALLSDRMLAWAAAAAATDVALVRTGDSASVVCDDVAVASAVDVLLDNAIKFSPPYSTVSVNSRAAGEWVTITVADQGDGLEPDELARAGDRFWRSRRHQNVPGSGLGLSIAQTLLNTSGARLELSTGRNRGLVASIRIPLRPKTRLAEGVPLAPAGGRSA